MSIERAFTEQGCRDEEKAIAEREMEISIHGVSQPKENGSESEDLWREGSARQGTWVEASASESRGGDHKGEESDRVEKLNDHRHRRSKDCEICCDLVEAGRSDRSGEGWENEDDGGEGGNLFQSASWH